MDVLLEVFILDVRDGDADLVDVDLAVQGEPHPQRLDSLLEIRLLLVILLQCFEV